MQATIKIMETRIIENDFDELEYKNKLGYQKFFTVNVANLILSSIS